MKKILALIAIALSLSSCKGSSSVAGVTTPSAGSGSSSLGGTISGSVMGGLSPIKNATVQLFQAGNSSAVGQAVTSTNGSFSIPATFSSGLYYVLVTNGNAGSGANSQIQLMAIVAAGTSGASNVTVNELTTAAAGTVLFNFGLLSSSGSVSAPANANGAANALTQYNNLIIPNGSLNTGNGNLSTNQQNSLNTLANALASCVETSGSCSSLYGAAKSGGIAATSMMIATYNALSVTTNATPIYNVAKLQTATGIPIPGSAPTINNGVAATTSTISVGSGPVGLAIDGSSNAWVTNYHDNTVSEITSSGTTLGTFGTSLNPEGIAIDASGNVWIANGNAGFITELNSSGAAVGSSPYATGGHSAHSLAIDASGNVWGSVQDGGGGSSVMEFNSSGVQAAGSPFSVGSHPLGLAIAPSSGNVWVTNYLSNTVSILNPSGTVITTITGIAGSPNSIAFDNSGTAYVVSAFGTIYKINVSSATKTGTISRGCCSAQGIVVDTNGNLYVSGYEFGVLSSTSVAELTPSGTKIASFSGSNPNGLAIDASGNLWFTNYSTNKVTVVQGVAAGPQFFPYSGPIFPDSSF